MHSSDSISRDAASTIANAAGGSPQVDDASVRPKNVHEEGQFVKRTRRAARGGWAGEPRTVKIGYRGPTTRLAAISVRRQGLRFRPASPFRTSPRTPLAHKRVSDGAVEVMLAKHRRTPRQGSDGVVGIEAYAPKQAPEKLGRLHQGQIDRNHRADVGVSDDTS